MIILGIIIYLVVVILLSVNEISFHRRELAYDSKLLYLQHVEFTNTRVYYYSHIYENPFD